MKKNLKKFYSFENYKPNKNAKPIMYKGTQYLSKAQCMALEGITNKELNEYLNNQGIAANDEAPKQKVVNKIIGKIKLDHDDNDLADFLLDNADGIPF